MIDKKQIQVLLNNSIGQDFIRRSLIYEPEDITSLPASTDQDIQTTEILIASEYAVANFEEDTERMARSAAQTQSSVPGEIAPPIRETAT